MVVSTHNRPRDCDELLKSLASQTVEPHEVILIDDASWPPYRPRAKGLKGLRLFRAEEELGLALARLLGSRLATGDLVAFIDDDALAPENWVERIQEGGGRHGFHVFGGPVIPIYEAREPWWWDDRVLGRYIAVRTLFPVGCNYVVRKEAFELVGELNPLLGRYGGRLVSNEEVEFVLRAYLRGLKVGFDHGLIVYHKVKPYRLTVPYLLKRAWAQGLSIYLTVRRDLRLALLGRKLVASRTPPFWPTGSVKLSARLMEKTLLLITMLNYVLHVVCPPLVRMVSAR